MRKPKLTPCDCLTDCGDDPEIHRGYARPCTAYVGMMQRKRLIDAAPQLLCALKALLRDVKKVDAVGDYGLELQPAIYQAQRAIEQAELCAGAAAT